MTTHTRLRLGAVALVLLVVVLLSGSHLCGVALNKEASDPGMRPIGAGALACTEFWLNRYQTLIGAIAALIAAWLAWSVAQRQIAKAEQQAEISRAQFSIAALDPLLQRAENLRAILQQLADARNLLNRAIAAQVNVNNSLARIMRDHDNDHAGRYMLSVRAQTVDVDQIEKNFAAAHKHAANARKIAGKSLIETVVQAEISKEIEEIFFIDAYFQQDVYLARALREKIADPDADEIKVAWLESVAPHVSERRHIRVTSQSRLLRRAIANTKSLIDEHLALIANQARPGA